MKCRPINCSSRLLVHDDLIEALFFRYQSTEDHGRDPGIVKIVQNAGRRRAGNKDDATHLVGGEALYALELPVGILAAQHLHHLVTGGGDQLLDRVDDRREVCKCGVVDAQTDDR